MKGVCIDAPSELRFKPDAGCGRFKPKFGLPAVGKFGGNIAVNGCGGKPKFIASPYGERCCDSIVFDNSSRCISK